MSENSSNLSSYKIDNFKKFKFFPYNSKFLLASELGTILFIENGKSLYLPKLSSSDNWEILTKNYSTHNNNVTIIGDQILTINFSTNDNCHLNLYNKDMVLLDTNIYNMKNVNKLFKKQVGKNILFSSFCKYVTSTVKYERLNFDNLKNEDINLLKSDEALLAPNCISFILTINDNSICKKEFIDYAILESFNFNDLYYFIKNIMILENAKTQKSIIISPSGNKYQHIDGLCRYFCKTTEFYIIGITKLECLLYPYGNIDTLIYIPVDAN